jgi:pilus assembly protein CpaD
MTRIHDRCSDPDTRAARPNSRVGLAALAALLLAGACDRPRLPDAAHPLVTDPAKRHPIAVGAETAILELALDASGTGPETQSFLQTTRFLRRFRQEASGLLLVSAPRDRARGHAVAERMRVIRLVMAREGISASRMRLRHDAPADAIVLSYERIAAIGPVCANWSEDVTHNPENIPYPNYGCASQRNLAAMVANPTDAAFPTREVERQSDRRATVSKSFMTTPPAVVGGNAR